MTATSSSTPNGTVRRPGLGGLSASFRFGLPAVVSKGRLLGGLALFGLVVLQFSALPPEDFNNEGVSLTTVFLGLVIAILIPIFAVSTASNALGTPVSDGTLVYPWLRPTPRWQLALGHIGAALALQPPGRLLITAGGCGRCVANDSGDLGYIEGGIGHCRGLGRGSRRFGLHPPGRRSRGPIQAGLHLRLCVHLLLEQLFARNSTGVSRISIQTYVRSVFFGLRERRLPTATSGARSGSVSLLVSDVVGTCSPPWPNELTPSTGRPHRLAHIGGPTSS